MATSRVLGAVRETLQHPTRTLLVSQGVLWAVALALAPSIIIEGSRARAVDRAAELRTDRIEILPAPDPDLDPAAKPVIGDLEVFSEFRSRIVADAPFRVRAARAESDAAWLIGTRSGYGEARRIEVLAGRWPDLDAAKSRRTLEYEAAVEITLAKRLVGDGAEPASIVGARLRIQAERDARSRVTGIEIERLPPGGAPERGDANVTIVEVVGVLSDETATKVDAFGNAEGQLLSGQAQRILQLFGYLTKPEPWMVEGNGVIVPLAIVPGARIDAWLVRAQPLDVPELAAELQLRFTEIGRSVLVRTNAMLPILTSSEIEKLDELHDVLFLIGLAVGLVVLANMVAISGWRRRREIAIRRAEGARRTDIFVQFVIEGVIVSLVGAVLGIAFGYGIAFVRVTIDPNVVLGLGLPGAELLRIVVVVTAGAIAASAIPAWRASGHDPVELLRRSGS